MKKIVLLFAFYFYFFFNHLFAQTPDFSGFSLNSNKQILSKIDSLVFDGNTTVQIDTFQVSFVPPQYSMKINAYTFISPATTSSIQIKEIQKAVYPIVVQNIKSEILEPQGVHLISKENVVTFDNKEGILVLVTMKVDTIDFYRMMLFTGDYMRTVWITASYPVSMKDKVEAILRKSIFSVKF